MYWFGKTLATNSTEWMKPNSWDGMTEKRLSLSQTPILEIIDLLDRFSQHWSVNDCFMDECVPELLKDSGFSETEVVKTLKLLPELLKRESLLGRVESEFGQIEMLDRFHKTPRFQGKVRAVPRGPILHVTAGNVFLSSIDSLLMGFLTKNISILKVSGQNTFFPMYFAQRLREFDPELILADKFSVLHWKGGNVEVEGFVKGRISTILAWGGEEMVSAYSKSLPLGVKLLDFGPKISLQILSQQGLRNSDVKIVAQSIVDDIIPWDQAACASPQNLFIEDSFEVGELLQAIDEAFKATPARGEISDDEAVEIHKEAYRGLYSELMESGKVLAGSEHLIHMENNSFLRPSPLNRSLIIKRFKDKDDLIKSLMPFSYYLQSCAYLFNEDEKDDYLEALALTGIKRFAPLGSITWGMDGATHDGRFVLRELVDFVADEIRALNYGHSTESLSSSADLKEYFKSHAHPPGYIFASGGTTGEPKYVHFSYEEFDYMTDMLAVNFRAQGLKAGMTVANLFVAGNLWSSFMAVEKALEKIGAVQLPIGGLSSPDNIVSYLERFLPDVIMGIPSLIVMIAEHGEEAEKQLNIKHVFYAGEALSATRKEYLSKVWGAEYFGSAGYASVDAGVIGFQCERCAPGEHHLFSDQIELQIVEGEAIVTSLNRNTMPIKNYRTGDKVEWIEDCSCGRKEPRFKLLGRIDDLIQIWSCRLLLSDIEKSLKDVDPDIHTFQILLNHGDAKNTVAETLEVLFERSTGDIDVERLMFTIYENSRDLKDTLGLEDFKRYSRVRSVAHGEIPRNPRTGKISQVIDLRR